MRDRNRIRRSGSVLATENQASQRPDTQIRRCGRVRSGTRPSGAGGEEQKIRDDRREEILLENFPPRVFDRDRSVSNRSQFAQIIPPLKLLIAAIISPTSVRSSMQNNHLNLYPPFPLFNPNPYLSILRALTHYYIIILSF